MKIDLYLRAMLGCCLLLLCDSCLESSSQPIQVAIIGAGPAGLTAGIYAARAGLSTLVVEGNQLGGQIVLSNAVENFPGVPPTTTGADLTRNMKTQARSSGAIFVSGNVAHMDLSKRPFTLVMSQGQVFEADTIILAMGTNSRWLGLQSEKRLIGYGVSSCAVCDAPLYRAKPVLVVGGGDAALEEALYLSKFASQVTLIHRRDQFRASKHLQQLLFREPKIQIIWNGQIKEILGNQESGVEGALVYVKGAGEMQIPCRAVFVAIGQDPNTQLVRSAISLDSNGYILTQPGSTRTNVVGVFAAGDIADSRYRQAVTAAATGCMAALDAYQFIQNATYEVKP